MAQVDASPIYSSLAGDPLLGEMVVLFVQEMPDRTARIRALFQQQDWDALRRAAHQMKGAAGSYGFDALTPHSAALESAVTRRADLAEIKSAVETLLANCERIAHEQPR